MDEQNPTAEQLAYEAAGISSTANADTWRHLIPSNIDINVTRQATLKPGWAIAERLEEIALVLNEISNLLDERLAPPAP